MPASQEGLARLIDEILGDERISEAFRKVDRADHVPPQMARHAYSDRPVPIPENQTTSQPSLIAMMIAAAAPGPTDKVLEVGTGFGFQTALLAHLCKEVVSIERWPSLADTAAQILARNGKGNVSVYVGDGYEGYRERAPYAAIIVSAAADRLPDALAEQLDEGGRLVIPIEGPRGDDVWLFVKRDGVVEKARLVSPARFVPLVRGDSTG